MQETYKRKNYNLINSYFYYDERDALKVKRITLKNGEHLLIRKVEKEDIDEVMQYMSLIGGESDNLTFGDGEWTGTYEQELNYIENVNTSNSIMLVAIIDGKIVGSTSLSAGTRSRVKHTGEMGITVRKAYWNCGIGSLLLGELLNFAKKTKIIRKVNLIVKKDNLNAIRLYEKYGFKKEGLVTREFLVNGKFYDSVHMGLEID